MVMQALVQSSERWRTAELSFNADEGLLMLSRANSPRLKTIVLSGDPSEMVALDLLSVEGLRSITLRARHTSINPFLSYFRLRWDQLSHLSFGAPGLALKNVVPLLQKCLRLISFQTSIQGRYMDPLSLIVAPVSLACLEIFIIIDEIEVSHIEFLVRRLRMPQLRRFQVPNTLLCMMKQDFLADLAICSPLLEDLVIDLGRLTQRSLSENLS
jgi:hypothetical protein